MDAKLLEKLLRAAPKVHSQRGAYVKPELLGGLLCLVVIMRNGSWMSELARLANSTKLRKQENGLKMKVDLEMVLKVEVEVQKN